MFQISVCVCVCERERGVICVCSLVVWNVCLVQESVMCKNMTYFII